MKKENIGLSNEHQTFQVIVDYIKSNKHILKNQRIGLCRVWSSDVVRILKKNSCFGSAISFEIREVQIEVGVFHTFVRLIINNEAFLLDGVGVGKHEPFFGLESNAYHLQNSNFDILHYYFI